jgi:hypothetical protein
MLTGLASRLPQALACRAPRLPRSVGRLDPPPTAQVLPALMNMPKRSRAVNSIKARRSEPLITR